MQLSNTAGNCWCSGYRCDVIDLFKKPSSSMVLAATQTCSSSTPFSSIPGSELLKVSSTVPVFYISITLIGKNRSKGDFLIRLSLLIVYVQTSVLVYITLYINETTHPHFHFGCIFCLTAKKPALDWECKISPLFCFLFETFWLCVQNPLSWTRPFWLPRSTMT